MLRRNLKLIQSVILSLILITFLTSCSSVKELSIFKEEVPRAKLILDKPTPVEMEKIHWHIITSENAEEVFKKLEADGIDPVLWGLTDKDFELLAKNFAQIRNKMIETNKILEKYKEYYETEEKEDGKR